MIKTTTYKTRLSRTFHLNEKEAWLTLNFINDKGDHEIPLTLDRDECLELASILEEASKRLADPV